jgi:hypothetical protein
MRARPLGLINPQPKAWTESGSPKSTAAKTMPASRGRIERPAQEEDRPFLDLPPKNWTKGSWKILI